MEKPPIYILFVNIGHYWCTKLLYQEIFEFTYSFIIFKVTGSDKRRQAQKERERERVREKEREIEREREREKGEKSWQGKPRLIFDTTGPHPTIKGTRTIGAY